MKMYLFVFQMTQIKTPNMKMMKEKMLRNEQYFPPSCASSFYAYHLHTVLSVINLLVSMKTWMGPEWMSQFL